MRQGKDASCDRCGREVKTATGQEPIVLHCLTHSINPAWPHHRLDLCPECGVSFAAWRDAPSLQPEEPA